MSDTAYLSVTGQITRFVQRLTKSRSTAAQVLFDEILYVCSRTQSLEELLRTFPDRVCAALHLASFHILLREKTGYVLQHTAPADSLRITFPASSSTISRMRRDRKPAAFVPVSTPAGEADGWQLLAEPYELEALARLNAQLLLPLEGRTGLMGFATLSRTAKEPFSAAELRFLRDLGPEMGRGLETAQLVTSISQQAVERARAHRELELARAVQQRLLPTHLPSIPGIAGYAAYRSAEQIGGDYYDLIATPDGSICAVVGDVSGKGISAALLMAALRASIHALLLEPAQPITTLVERLNGLIYQASSASRYATLFLCFYEPANGKLTCVNAGHNPPILLRADGSIKRLDSGGTVIGLLPNQRFESETLVLEEGDTLFAFTDGVTEANNQAGQEWGDAALQAAIRDSARDEKRSTESIVQLVLHTLDTFVGPVPQNDDITLLALRRDIPDKD